ncbi:DUF2892 domain-containing protein [Haloarcula litorea]|uniref:DUF2892 domain-containing protein n=1 Tax=Haloarcula litorea TaxID=3032579 RepID=UPI0023E7643E|nr:DUF2892 domain-containing protein [Halomicroarcula sp. GDY20]
MDRSDADPGRLVRLLLAAVLALAALRSLRDGKRLRGLLAAAGAVAVGYDTVTRDIADVDVPDVVDEELSTDEDDAAGEEATAETETDGVEDAAVDASTNGHAADLVCADCGDPIVPGQNRGPNEDGEIVHDACD